MSLPTTSPLKLKINGHARKPAASPRFVRINTAVSEGDNDATRTAEKLVIASRENVAFLNTHLKKFERYLELPPLVNNALYLAYTINIRDDAPFEPLWLRRELAKAGIETSPTFSFTAAPEDGYTGPAINRIRKNAPQSRIESRSFCLGCHQYLTILDLWHIIDTFESIFCKFDNDQSATASNKKPGDII